MNHEIIALSQENQISSTSKVQAKHLSVSTSSKRRKIDKNHIQENGIVVKMNMFWFSL